MKIHKTVLRCMASHPVDTVEAITHSKRISEIWSSHDERCYCHVCRLFYAAHAYINEETKGKQEEVVSP